MFSDKNFTYPIYGIQLFTVIIYAIIWHVLNKLTLLIMLQSFLELDDFQEIKYPK